MKLQKQNLIKQLKSFGTKLWKYFVSGLKWSLSHKRKIVMIVLSLITILAAILYSLNAYYANKLQQYIKNSSDVESLEFRNVGLVLGAGYNKDTGSLSPMLQDRLNVGKQLLDQGKVAKLILSGDNRFQDYNEPEVMRQYLVKKGVSSYKLVLDYAGRSTYDSCYRAKEIFGQNKIFVVTQDFHMLRAVFICKSLGIDTIGITSDLQQYPNLWMNVVRDYVALFDAFMDVKVFKPTPVLGDKINIMTNY